MQDNEGLVRLEGECGHKELSCNLYQFMRSRRPVLFSLYLRTKMDLTVNKSSTAGKSEALVGNSEFVKEKVCYLYL